MITFSKLGEYGRLGNQLFQIASTIGIAIKNGHKFCFPEWKYSNYFKNFPEPCTMYPNYVVKEESPYYNDYNFPKESNIELIGYFQSWKYFNRCLATIYYYLEFEKSQYNGVAVHIRRGDYLNSPINPVLPLSYYNDAMEQFNGEHFTIFSDDIQWCKENIKGYGITYNTTEDDISDFKTMSGFNKFIIANSSYSWWAAYLSRSTKVIAPNNYVIGEIKDDRIPPEWIKI